MAAGGAVLVGRPMALLCGAPGAGPGAPAGGEGRGAAGSIAEQPMAPRSGRRGATMFKMLSPQETGVVAENRFDDPRMWGALYSENERSEEHTSELQSLRHLVCRLLLE